MPKIDDVLAYLSVWRTRHQIQEEFSLSNTESYNLINWLKKRNDILESKLRVEGHQNKCWFYKKNENKSSDSNTD